VSVTTNTDTALRECRTNAVGASLLEVMIAIAAGFMVMSATLHAFDQFGGRFVAQLDTMARHQDQRLGMRVFQEELRLAGSGAFEGQPALLTAGRQEIEFLANLDGKRTTLTNPVSAVQLNLSVLDGSDWRKGKHAVVCAEERCALGELAQDGRRNGLTLVSGLGQAFPAGGEVFISNRVRYYVTTGALGKLVLMREVDGGANSIIGEVSRFALRYVDHVGRPTVSPALVGRVRVEIVVGGEHRSLATEVGLRGRLS
jgi:hypothetical protein